MRLISKKQTAFKKIIWKFYARNKRAMPWRRTRDPYKILVSEVMLQQTQVASVLKKYSPFIRAFPNFSVLSRAPLKKILTVWQGLGYNRRAIALKKIAEIVTKKYGGKLPEDTTLLETLPGIGHATASSITVFAFNAPAMFIETNIRRVFIHFFFKNRQHVHDKEILPLVETTLDRKHPRAWYFALMDYGAWLGQTKENENRKSAHYVRQSIFKGSRRETRGKILKYLLKTRRTSLPTIATHIKRSKKDIALVLQALIKERFLKKHGAQYSLTP